MYLKVGAAAAYLQLGVISMSRYWLLLGSSFLVITWLNLRLMNSNYTSPQVHCSDFTTRSFLTSLVDAEATPLKVPIVQESEMFPVVFLQQ